MLVHWDVSAPCCYAHGDGDGSLHVARWEIPLVRHAASGMAVKAACLSRRRMQCIPLSFTGGVALLYGIRVGGHELLWLEHSWVWSCLVR